MPHAHLFLGTLTLSSSKARVFAPLSNSPYGYIMRPGRVATSFGMDTLKCEMMSRKMSRGPVMRVLELVNYHSLLETNVVSSKFSEIGLGIGIGSK
jgi:hypothetical protein